MDFIVFTGTFIAIYYFDVSVGFESFYEVNNINAKILVLIGYIFWQNSSAALGYVNDTVSSEATAGIFEMRLQSIFSMEWIWFFRLLVSCIIHLVTYVGILVFGSVVVGFDSWSVYAICISIILSFPALLGMYGIGLIFGSFTVMEKNVGSLILIIQTILLFVTNTLSPCRGSWIYLVPFTSGIEIVRKIYLELPVPIELVMAYVVVNIVWFFIGSLSYKLVVRYERKYGSFDNY
ncbi:MAG: hypothetical protein UFG06_03410 [Lachnospiraceae bacterium]|nr:hypothetical protein [Lachnospiraceae bacterium]